MIDNNKYNEILKLAFKYNPELVDKFNTIKAKLPQEVFKKIKIGEDFEYIERGIRAKLDTVGGNAGIAIFARVSNLDSEIRFFLQNKELPTQETELNSRICDLIIEEEDIVYRYAYKIVPTSNGYILKMKRTATSRENANLAYEPEKFEQFSLTAQDIEKIFKEGLTV